MQACVDVDKKMPVDLVESDNFIVIPRVARYAFWAY